MDFKLTKGQASKNNDSENNKNKVIRLNNKYTRRVQMRQEINHKKGAAIASILSLVAIVTILNQNLIQKNQTLLASRQIASAENETKLRAWKSELLKDLSDKSNRSIASFGEAPSPLEELRMGALEGKYAFSLNENSISSIQFIETQDGDRPKSFKSYSEFINQHLKAFSPEAALLVEVGSENQQNQKLYTFDLLTESQSSVGKVHIVADSSNRLLEIKYVKSIN